MQEHVDLLCVDVQKRLRMQENDSESTQTIDQDTLVRIFLVIIIYLFQIQNARKKIKIFTEKLIEDQTKPGRRLLPSDIVNLKTEVCFFLSGYNTGKVKKDYGLHRRPQSWLQHQMCMASKVIVPFPGRLLEKMLFNEIFRQEYHPRKNTIFQTASGEILIAIFRNAVPSDLVEHVESITTSLVATHTPHQTEQSGRGKGNYYLFGFHRFCSPETTVYVHMLEQPFISWINKMRPYFEIVKALLGKHIPGMLKLSSKLSQDDNPLHPYTSGQINSNTIAMVHTDSHDLFGSMNCLTTFGRYSGGGLSFPDIKIEFDVQPGDIIFFEGSRLRHSVIPIAENESRTSINLYVNTNAFIN